MSPVELWRSAKWVTSEKVEDWAVVFSHPQNLVLVESKDEEDYIWAMQMLHGGEVRIEQFDSDKPLRTYRMSTNGHVFTTWDSADRNRI